MLLLHLFTRKIAPIPTVQMDSSPISLQDASSRAQKNDHYENESNVSPALFHPFAECGSHTYTGKPKYNKLY